jgi:hypothetical protein
MPSGSDVRPVVLISSPSLYKLLSSFSLSLAFYAFQSILQVPSAKKLLIAAALFDSQLSCPGQAALPKHSQRIQYRLPFLA